MKNLMILCVLATSLPLWAAEAIKPTQLLVGISTHDAPVEGAYPWGHCSGVAIGARRVLTTAACVLSRDGNLQTRDPLYVQPLPMDAPRIKVTKVNPAPSYYSAAEKAPLAVATPSNLAVLELESDLPVHDDEILLTPIPSPALADGNYTSCSMVAMRSGELPNGSITNELSSQAYPLRVNSETWAEWRQLFLIKHTFMLTAPSDIVLTLTSTRDVGDLGNPVFCEIQGKTTLVGIATGAYSSGFEVVQDLNDFKPWISDLL